MRTWYLLTVLACSGCARPETVDYAFDKVHSQLHASVFHMGMSSSTARFRVKDGTIRFDAKDWTRSSVDVTVDVAGFDLGDPAWNQHVGARKWLYVSDFPEAHFVSTRVEKTGEQSLRIDGDLTLRGVTQAVTLDATINLVGPHPSSRKPALGISASTTLKRSGFGITDYLPAISDEVRIRIELEATAG